MIAGKEEKVHPHDPDPSHYLWASVPIPVIHSDLSANERLVYLSYFAATRVHRLRGRSVSQVARDLRLSRSTVKDAMRVLEDRGFIRREYRRTNAGTEVVRVFLFIPEGTDGAGEWLQMVPEGEDENIDPGRDSATPGRNAATPGRDSATIRRRERFRERKGENTTSGIGNAMPDAGGPGEDAGEELNPDSGSREAETFLARKKGERDAQREARRTRKNGNRGPRKASALPSGEDCRETPSARWEYNAWRTKDDASAWSGTDMVGYWVTRFREVRKEEDRDFKVSDTSSGYARAARKLVLQFVSLNLGGTSVAYRDAVELVLAHAEKQGSPVSFRYFFGTPGNPGALETLRRKVRRPGGRAPSPIEANDASGANREYWDRKCKEDYEMRERKAKKLGIPLEQVSLHVGEVVD